MLTSFLTNSLIYYFFYRLIHHIYPGSKYLTFDGHSSHVSNVKWTVGGNHLISTGGNDKCIFVWEMTET